MITTGSKFWFAVSAAALVAAVVYAVASGGEKVGVYVLVFLLFASLFVGLVMVVTRDGGIGPETLAAGAAPAEAEPQGQVTPPSPWPAVAAFGAGLVIVGLAAGGWLVYVGLAVLVAVLVEWMVQAWSERASADQAYNRRLRDHLMYPVEIPVLAIATVAGVVLAFSRVLLALPRTGSTVVAIAVAAAILLGGWLIAARPRLSSNVLTALLVVAALVVLGGGIVGAVVGEREFEEHGAEEEHAEEGAGPEAGDPETGGDEGG